MKLKELIKNRRFTAKLTDYFIFYTVLSIIATALPVFLGMFFYIGLVLVLPFLWIPVEAFLISKFMTTPGKALFGIEVTDEKGCSLAFSRSWKRSMWWTRVKAGMFRMKKLSAKRHLIALITACCCLGAACFSKPLTTFSLGIQGGISINDWKQYYSMTRGFAVSFPTDPEAQSKEVRIPDMGKTLQYEELTSYQTKNVLYSVSYMEFPSKWKWAGSSTLLKGALDLIIKYSPTQTDLVDKKFTYHQGQRSLDFHVKQGGEETKGRLILVRNTLYKLTVTYPSSLVNDIEDEAFLNSFDLAPKGISKT